MANLQNKGMRGSLILANGQRIFKPSTYLTNYLVNGVKIIFQLVKV